MSIKGTKRQDNFTLFYGFLSPFSNFYMGFPFEYKNKLFACSEQAYMWEKALFANDVVSAKDILETQEPSRMKNLGAKIVGLNKEDWEQCKADVMFDILTAKFTEPTLRKELLNTDDTILVEASTDKFWGSGYHMNNLYATEMMKWKGRNRLGFLLMRVRKDIREHSQTV